MNRTIGGNGPNYVSHKEWAWRWMGIRSQLNIDRSDLAPVSRGQELLPLQGQKSGAAEALVP